MEPDDIHSETDVVLRADWPRCTPGSASINVKGRLLYHETLALLWRPEAEGDNGYINTPVPIPQDIAPHLVHHEDHTRASLEFIINE